MSRESFLSIICFHSLTKCTCCCGLSGNGVAFLQALFQQAPECVLQQGVVPAPLGSGFSNLPLLLQTDWSNQRRPSWPSSFTVPGHHPLHSGTARRSADRPQSSGLLPLHWQEHWWIKVSILLRLYVDMYAHISRCIFIQFFLGNEQSIAEGPGVRAIGLHSSSCIHLIYHGALNNWPSVSLSVNCWRQCLHC